jgi:hypothetical protein
MHVNAFVINTGIERRVREGERGGEWREGGREVGEGEAEGEGEGEGEGALVECGRRRC